MSRVSIQHRQDASTSHISWQSGPKFDPCKTARGTFHCYEPAQQGHRYGST